MIISMKLSCNVIKDTKELLIKYNFFNIQSIYQNILIGIHQSYLYKLYYKNAILNTSK